MTYGTAKVYKTSSRQGKDGSFTLGIVIPKDVVVDQGIVAGATVQFDLTLRPNIPVTEPVHGKNKFKKIDVSEAKM